MIARDNVLVLDRLRKWKGPHTEFSVRYWGRDTDDKGFTEVVLFDTVSFRSVKVEVAPAEGDFIDAIKLALDKWDRGEFSNSWTQQKE